MQRYLYFGSRLLKLRWTALAADAAIAVILAMAAIPAMAALATIPAIAAEVAIAAMPWSAT